jgi:plastocyanin
MKYTLAIPALVLLASCSGGDRAGESAGSSALPPAPAVLGDLGVTGKVNYSGPPAVRRPISMDSTPACARQHATPVLSEELLVSANGEVQNVFVWVKSGLPEFQWTPPSAPVTIDQVGCIYTPHVAGVMVGQGVEFLNSDPTNHNIHPLPTVNREWNRSQPPSGEPIVQSFDKVELGLPIKCNVHPWMRTYVNVSPHPFFAVTGPDGSFEIKGLPPGQYTLEAWHETLGTLEIPVTVTQGAANAATFEFKR